jgi:phospholipid/cholesterol/gamma-HCH transport system substrate-binding protein
MASPKRVRWAELRVGILALAALAIAAVLIFLLTSNTEFFEDRFILRTYMDDSAAMAESSPVRLNGIAVGNIEHIRLTGSKDPHRIVEINMSILGKFRRSIPTDSVAGVSAANLLGDKYINITEGRSSEFVSNGSEIKSQDVIDIPQLLQQSATILTQFQGIVGKADGLLNFVSSGQGNIGLLIKDDTLYKQANQAVNQINQIVGDIRSSKGTVSKLIYDDQLYNDIRSPINRLDDILAQLQAGKGSAGKLLKDEAIYDEARLSLTEARKMLDDLNAGKGSAGKLLKDEDLYRQVDLLVAKVNTAIDKINSGQGTVGQLVINPQLYDALNGATREAQLLVQDIRKNPKKFLRIKLAIF